MSEDHNYFQRNGPMGRPHVVLLGAGASLQAFPEGDANGRKLPLMANLVEEVGLQTVLGNAGIPWDGENFEDIFSAIYDAGNSRLLERIENKVYAYFKSLRLPDLPTLYDHLVLSLRKKDLIATFNWDPFLIQAIDRNFKKAELPQVAFLHGCATVGCCLKDRIIGPAGGYCAKCGSLYDTSKLLYPIKKKGYNGDQFIRRQWDILDQYLEHAYMLTIFGYSAPTSDYEAMEMIKRAWGGKKVRNLEEIEIIDIKAEEELTKTWNSLIFEGHYRTCKSFHDSWIAEHPRRSCEAMRAQLMDCDFLDRDFESLGTAWTEIDLWLRRLILQEEEQIKK